MASLKLNTIANFFGQILTALVSFALVPLYVKYLGVESYGLIGFFVSLQALISIMDFGLATTANREVARNAANPDHVTEVLSTLQYVYGAFGLVIAGLFIVFAEFIASSWVTANSIPSEVVKSAVIMFGLTVGMRWPIGLYSGILRGVEKQVLLNLVSIIATITKGIGSAFIVIYIPDALLTLIKWQLLVGVGELLLYATFAWKSVPSSRASRFSFSRSALKSVLGFSCTVALISIFAVAIKQLDKLIISKVLSLEDLGYYTTAFQAYTAIQIFITPVSTAVFPRLSSIINSVEQTGLSDIYRKTTKVISFVSSPVASLFIFFSHDIILLWTKNAMVASKACASLSCLAIAALFNSVMQASFILQLAAGLQRLALINNMIAFFLFTPLTYFLVLKFGIIGGAISWAVYNVLYFLIMPSITHRYILRGNFKAWMLHDTLPFFVLSVTIIGICDALTAGLPSILRLGAAGVAGIVYVIIACFADEAVRTQMDDLKSALLKKTRIVS